MPFPEEKGSDRLLEGWSVNSAVLLQSGLPYTPTDTRDISKTGDKKSDRWDFFGNPSDFKAGKFPIPFFRADQLAPQRYSGHRARQECYAATIGTDCWQFGEVRLFCQGQFGVNRAADRHVGTAGRNIFRDDGFRDWDFSVFKNWTVKERLTAQFRAEFFNILNQTILANPGSSGLTGNGQYRLWVPNA